jgi:1,4-dihydroxy-2-naphthoate octaprenyltransferase
VILAYNKELFKGRFHNGTVFSIGWGGIPTLGSYYLQTINISLTVLLAAAGTIVFSLAIWTLNHEFRPDLESVKNFATRQKEPEALASRRSAGRGIWKITRILCYSITLFTIAFYAYRFLP